MDNFTSLWRRLIARAPSVDPLLAQDYIRDSFNNLVEQRLWSWRQSSGAFIPKTPYNTGTMDLVLGSNMVTGTGTNWDQTHVGMQFRINQNYPVYTILSVLSPTSLVIDRPWANATVLSSPYQIFLVYFTVPEDFSHFVSVTNPGAYYKLAVDYTQANLDAADPQRAFNGLPYVAAFKDFGVSPSQGVVSPPLQVNSLTYNTPPRYIRSRKRIHLPSPSYLHHPHNRHWCDRGGHFRMVYLGCHFC